LLRVARFGRFARIAPGLVAVSGAVLVALAGLVLAVELLYRRTQESGGPLVCILGLPLDAHAVTPWLVALALFTAGVLAYRALCPAYLGHWEAVHGEIAALSKGRHP
ncbi:MAG: branched-chain amino acid ABC transporter permease, partial [Tardiphaga sp.]|nr:branched-chain amino acid ABC transporter permease [Tardiphaga sp.]